MKAKNIKAKVILNTRIRRLGGQGTTVLVSKGYARNYLFRENLAVPFTPERAEIIENSKEQGTKININYNEIFEKINNQYVIFLRQASTLKVLYGSVTIKDIVKEINSKFNINIEQRHINLNHIIKKTGLYDIKIDLGDFVAKLSVAVSVTENDALDLLKVNA